MESIFVAGILFVVSLIFKFFPPQKVNKIYGYRTPRSMKSEHNWKIANEFSASLMTSASGLLLVFSIGLNYFIPQYALPITLILLVVIIGLMIYKTESKLKKQ